MEFDDLMRSLDLTRFHCASRCDDKEKRERERESMAGNSDLTRPVRPSVRLLSIIIELDRSALLCEHNGNGMQPLINPIRRH